MTITILKIIGIISLVLLFTLTWIPFIAVVIGDNMLTNDKPKPTYPTKETEKPKGSKYGKRI